MNLPLPLKVVNIIGFFLFALFSWVQFNDIDPEVYHKPSSLDAALWLLFYALIAVLFLVTIFKRIPTWLFLVGAIACLAELIRTGPGLWENVFGEQPFTMLAESMSGTDPRVELSREFFGALIALAAIAFLWWQRRKFAKSTGA